MAEKTTVFDDEGDVIEEGATPSYFEIDTDEVVFDPGMNLFNPTVKVPFRHPEDETKKVVFFGIRYDSGGSLLTHDTSVIESLLRLNRIAKITGEEDLKNMPDEDIADLFDEDKYIEDFRNSDHYKILVVSYCLRKPALSPSQILLSLPKAWWEKLYKAFTGGLSQKELDAIDMFPDKATAEQERDPAEGSA